MFQHGPGEGYMAAKDDVLELAPKAVCRQIGGPDGVTGYAVFLNSADDHWIGTGAIARDAWGDVLHKLKAQPKEPDRG